MYLHVFGRSYVYLVVSRCIQLYLFGFVCIQVYLVVLGVSTNVFKCIQLNLRCFPTCPSILYLCMYACMYVFMYGMYGMYGMVWDGLMWYGMICMYKAQKGALLCPRIYSASTQGLKIGRIRESGSPRLVLVEAGHWVIWEGRSGREI